MRSPAGLYAWARSSKGDKDGNKLVSVEKGSITEKAIAVGQIQPRQKFQVKSKISGIIRHCMVSVGDKVRAGDALFEIGPDPTPQELTDVDRSVDSANASYSRAKADYERSIELSRSGVVPKSDLDSKREAFELAKIAVARAEQGRDLTRKGRVSTANVTIESIIRAPAAGTILTRVVNPGDPVTPLTSYQPGTELATIADMSDLIFKGTVDEIDVGKLRVGVARADQGRGAPDRRRDGPRLAHRAAGAAEGGRDALRRRDRARPVDPNRAARGLLGQRRPDHPREEGRPRPAGARRDLRGRRQEDLRRDPRREGKGRAEEDRGQARHLRRHERRGRLRPREGREGGRAAAEEDQ